MKNADFRLRMLFVALSMMAILSSAVGGSLYYSALIKSSRDRVHTEASEHLQGLAHNIDSYLAWSLLSVKSLAGLKGLEQSLMQKNAVAIRDANATLDHFRDVLNVSVCYLMDHDGKTIASSNRNEKDSFVGKNYGFRPYFKQSIKGLPSVHMALGVTSQKRGIYYSYPVYGENRREPLGVAVIKAPIEPIEADLVTSRHGILLLTDPNGMVFVSNRPDWLYHLLWPVSQEKISKVMKTKQFGTGPWNWTGMKKLNRNTAVDDKGNEYRIHRQALVNYTGWHVVYLHSRAEVMEKIISPLQKSVGGIVVTLCVLFGGIVFFLFVKANKSIVQREKAEQELKKSKEELKSIFRAAPTGIGLVYGRCIQQVNDRICEMTGYSRDELIGQSARIFFSGDEDYAHVGMEEDSRSQHGETGTVETRFKRKNGEIINVLMSSTPLDPANISGGITFTALDITEQRKLETRLKQTQKMEAIGTLAGGIAHDFNNILFPVLGHTEILLQDIPEDSPTHGRLEKIYAGALRARDLVKQILTFSRQDGFDLKTMKLQPLIREALKFIRSTIPTTIEIKEDINRDCGSVKADATQIHQVVMNLTTNAYHAMAKTGGVLTVSLEQIEMTALDIITSDIEPGVYACLTVADTGIGMDKALIGKIFDPFFTTKEKGKGTGMGLSVVHGIVAGMNGTIRAYSEPYKGSKFNIYLPVKKKEAEKQRIETREPVRGGTERILLVDDEKDIVQLGEQMLERLGYRVDASTDSIKALEIFRKAPFQYDMVITDVAMPSMSGDKLAAELIRIRPDIPVVLCTGFTDNLSEKKVGDLGIKGFFIKPISLKHLARNVRDVLDSASI